MQHHRSGSRRAADDGPWARWLAGRFGAVAVAAVACAALVGCSGDSGQDASGQGDADESASYADRAASAGGGGSAEELTATGAVVEASGPVAVDGDPPDAAAARLQTFAADLDLGVEQLDDAVAEASAAIEQLGGFAADEDVDLAGSERATVVYRVPAAEFRPALDALADVGALRRQSIGSEDVTAQYSDLESRVTTLRTSITRLQGFLAETTDVNQIASLEGELTRREAELESIESQRRVLADQVALSTITVEFDAGRGSDQIVADDTPGFRGGLEAGWDAARVVTAVIAATAGFLVPLLPLIAVVALAVWWTRRRRGRRGMPGTAAPTGE